MANKSIVTILKRISVTLCMITYINCTSQLSKEEQQIINQAKENFVFVEGGTFIMGENNTPIAPEHEVTLSSYSISKYETTWKEYDLFRKKNGLEIMAPDYRDTVEGYCDSCPAKKASWYTAKEYCQWLGKQLNLPLDLPTEAQWEFAARSRGKNVFHATDNGKIVGSYTVKRNYDLNKKVGSFAPNPLGIYDMSGGRPEWTNDYMWAYEGPVTDPRFDTIDLNKEKVVRGFHNLYNSTYLRGSRDPNLIDGNIGFRCACNKETPVN
ncbi:formylglycine-generating enzyme family protein [Tenacibaculum geojense]|uniref:Formylglycine-generating enzyme family protein n=1 Tax=Tenacibaculum geojense TaxID=915352 RepID=A0ABW3JPE5_9FLAO